MQWHNVFRNQQRWNWHLVLYFFNVFLVVYGYGLRGDSFQAAKLFRTGLVVVSLAGILLAQGQIKYIFNQGKNWVLYGFVGLNVVVLPFSVEVSRSFGRILSWIPFLIYTNYFIVYLFRHYAKDEAKIKLLQIFSLIYFYPVAVMLFTGVAFQSENVYGQYVGAYKANIIGWSCTMFVVMSFDLYANLPMSRWLRYLFFLTSFVVLWAIVLTGSRSSYAGLAVSSLVLVTRSRIISTYLKIGASICIIAFAYYIVASPDSVVNLRAKYANIRRQRGEVRFKLAQEAFKVFSEYPNVLITGFGFDGFRAGLERYAGVRTELASHNSYLEVLFSGGILCFLFFLIFYAINAFLKYLRFDSQYFIFLPALMIIPYFESNLNAGQFLFFPWMTFMFYYIHVSSLQFPVEEMAVSKKKIRIGE
ncbi:O-antigen ligase [Runella sp.]|uniref:O-antigen ligase family protein n=1 Tax=Runella sp. TaxID=1960881 RepID=UPI00262B4264|nr:O-antigen ligase family protein [Runella sp.]